MGTFRFYIIIALLALLGVVTYIFIYYGNEPVVESRREYEQEIKNEKFSLNSVIVSLKSTAPLAGSDVYTKIYIADSGRKYCSVTDTKLTYQEHEIVSTEISVTTNGFIYTYNPEKRTGIKYVNTKKSHPLIIDFASLDLLQMEAQGIEYNGKETILGKECQVFTLNKPELKMEGRYCVWQTIPLRYRTIIGDLDLEMVATKVEENVSIPKNIFLIPDNIKFNSLAGDSTSLNKPVSSKNQ